MKNVLDTTLALARGRASDLPLPGVGRWGKVLQLHTSQLGQQGPRTSVTFIATDLLPVVTPMAVQLRFSLDGVTFSPSVPSAFGGELTVTFTQTIDMKSGAFREQFTLVADQAQPFCSVIARALAVDVRLDGESTSIWVQAVACPTTNIDCEALAPGSGGGNAAAATIQRVVPVTTSDGAVILPANPLRRGLIVQNHAQSTMYVAYGPEARAPGDEGGELWSVILPPLVTSGDQGISQFAGDTYTGVVSAVWDLFGGVDPLGFAMVTELLPS